MATFINQKYLDRFTVTKEPEEATFIADKLLTPVNVKYPAGKYSIFSRFPSKLVNSKTGIKSPATEIDTTRDKTDGTFSTTEYSLKALITDKEARVYKDFTNLVEDAVLSLKKDLLIEKEYDVAVNMMNAGISGASGTYHDTPSIKWDGTSPTIENDIRDAITSFKNNALVKPNTIVIPDQVWDKIVTDSTLRDIWKLVPGRKNQDIELSSLVSLLFKNFKNVLIPDGQYDTASKGVAESLSNIWTDNVILLYIKGGKGTPKTFTYASRFIYQGWNSKQFKNEDPAGIKVRIGFEEDREVVSTAARYVIKDVLT